jgi:deoxyadenosine/deoxycytidine kinase
MKWFVAVAGNIGVGKSTLVKLLSEKLGWEPFFEPEAENPYLSDFYDNMQAWSFHSQIFFLSRRLQIHRLLANHPTSALQDRSVYEDAEVFARNLNLQGHMSSRDYQTYGELFEVMSQFLPPPDLVVYLRASVPTLQDRIKNRGRQYEMQIRTEYLSRLNDLYEQWVQGFTLCPVLALPCDDLDYVSHDAHLELVVSKIRDKLAGKEEVVFHAEEIPPT